MAKPCYLPNTTLAVCDGEANSHAGKGVESLTDSIIAAVARESPACAFMLDIHGGSLQKKKPLIGAGRHLVLEAPHPSQLPAYRGFLGCCTQCRRFVKLDHQ